ncbi:MAG: DNA cytosine methyltransferase [Mariprofundaceae bacterium]
MSLSYYEFFAGGGMARLGLGERWRCLFANDICPKKGASYRRNSPPDEALRVADVWGLNASDLPGRADLAWASFPCQDLSLAGARGGLSAKRSGAFWGFWRLMKALAEEGRSPSTLVLENVVGLLTSHHGADFQTLLKVLKDAGYRAGAVVIDGAYFTPQSRPRLFIVATKIKQENTIAPDACWLSNTLLKAYDQLPATLRDNWLWLPLPAPPLRSIGLDRVIETDLPSKAWHSREETSRLLGQMSPSNKFKVEQAMALARRGHGRVIGTGYRRTRVEQGCRVQRFEVRFDGLAGCLRTPGGGSSRQFVVLAESGRIRTRLLTAREAARLMDVPEWYVLPERYNEAYHLLGDGLVVGAVRWLAEHVLTPLTEGESKSNEQAKCDSMLPVARNA